MLASQVIGTVVARDADVAFGVPGSGNFLTINALRDAGAEFVGATHEGGAVGMADGYARVSGRVGVASVHQGPGLTNTITALTEAVKSRTPVVVLAADSASEGARANQRIDQDRLVESVGAGVVRLRQPEDAAQTTATAFARAQAERRPIVAMLPIDVAGSATVAQDLPPAPAAAPLHADDSVSADLAALEEAIGHARRPLILAGRGAFGAEAALRALAERLGAALSTTLPARGLFHADPFCIGTLGGLASSLATKIAGEADLVLAFGTSLDAWATAGGRLFGADARIVLVDDDPAALARHPGVLGLCGDCASVASRLDGRQEVTWRDGELAARIAAASARPTIEDQAADDLDPRLLAVALDDRLPPDRIVSVDSGHFLVWPSLYVGVDRPRSFLFVQGFQAVGVALAVAIGASIAARSRVTCAMVGDGGAQMSLLELDTAVREHLPLLVAIFNDRAYGAEVHDFEPHGIPVDVARLPDRDFAALARALGARGATVRRLRDLELLDEWLAAPSGPLVLDCKVDPEVDAAAVMTDIGAAEWALSDPFARLQPHGGS